MSDLTRSVRARRFRLGAATAGAVAAVGAAVLAFAAPASAAASITVTPSSGLSDGQTVTVKGTGFAPNTQVLVLECPANATGSNGGSVCDVNDGKIGNNSSDASGNFTTTLTVKVKPSSSVDCTKQACVIQAHEGFNPNSGQTATAPISFAALSGGGTSSSAAPPTTSATGGTTSAPPATGSGGTGSGGSGGAPGVPTGANTGEAATSGPLPLVAEILAGLAVALVATSLTLHRRRSRS